MNDRITFTTDQIESIILAIAAAAVALKIAIWLLGFLVTPMWFGLCIGGGFLAGALTAKRGWFDAPDIEAYDEFEMRSIRNGQDRRSFDA